jgi:hypothetical protein
MKVLLVGLGKSACEFVNEFLLVEKKRTKSRKDGMKSSIFNVSAPIMMIIVVEVFTHLIYFIYHFLLNEPQQSYYILSGFYISLAGFWIFNLMMVLFLYTHLGRHISGLYADFEDIEKLKEIKIDLKKKKRHVINQKTEDIIPRIQKFQNRILFYGIFISTLTASISGTYFYNHQLPISYFMESMASILGKRYALVEYFVYSWFLPAVLSLILSKTMQIYYLPSLEKIEVGETEPVKIKRNNVEGIGISYNQDLEELKYIDKFVIGADSSEELRSRLKNRILNILNDKIIKEGKVYDLVFFFGNSDSDIIVNFSEVVSNIKKSVTQPLWLYLQISGNYIESEFQYNSLKNLLHEVDGILIEEESGRIFSLHEDKDRFAIRTRMLERLLAIGESLYVTSESGLDFGRIEQFVEKEGFTAMGFGYLGEVPEGENCRLISEMVNFTIDHRITSDVDSSNAQGVLAVVNINNCAQMGAAGISEENPETGSIRDQLWEKFRENIEIYDVQYKTELNEREIRDAEIFSLDNDGRVTQLSANDKLSLLDSLELKNPLIEDLNLKEVLILLNGISFESVINKHLLWERNRTDFMLDLKKGLVLDFSIFVREPEVAQKFLENSSEFHVEDVFFSPNYFKMNPYLIIEKLEALGSEIEHKKSFSSKFHKFYKSNERNIKKITNKSARVLTKSEGSVESLLRKLCDETGYSEDNSQFFIDELRLCFGNNESYIIAFAHSTTEPEIFDFLSKVAHSKCIDMENLTGKYEYAIREWGSSKLSLDVLNSMYLFKIEFKSAEEGMDIKSIGYIGGLHGRNR